jgi:REP element-mobilizing transposase RayT
VLPGTTYLVTRRCFQRQLLLRPSEATTATVRFVLAVAARRFGIRLHAFCVLSNHLHIVLTDPYARLPAFSQYLDGLVARAVNASLGRWESFWAPGSFSAVALASPADIIEKAAYTLGNPVAAGLVRRGRDWPGLWSDPAAVGAGAVVVERPTGGFFREKGDMPERAELSLVAPPGFESVAAFQQQLGAALEAIERHHAGQPVLGAAKVRAQSPWARPKPGEPRRRLNPRVACRDRWKRVEMLGRLVTFLEQYRHAWRRWAAGDRLAPFPAGTYGLRVCHGAVCASG